MTGRKKPDMSEAEKEHEYVMAQKRGYGETIVGEGGEDLAHQGAAAEVAHERMRWQKEHGKRHEGVDASRPDES